MTDREKVIKGLECCMKWTGEPNTATCHCSDCSYTNMDILGERCLIDLINDALALLKEQESATEFILDDYQPTCKTCGFKPFVGYIPKIEWMKERGYKYCPGCGMAVKW